jgi:hypothetical protein
MRPWLILTLLLAIPACTEFPELDAKVDAAARTAPYPDLIPVEEIRARVAAPQIETSTSSDVNARAARLRARAARLRATPIN